MRFPNESEQYRRARTALLAEEIELRRHIERVAAQRRALPPGGEVTKDYRFEGEDGPVELRRPVRRQGDARGLQLHVRARARSALPDVHLPHERLGRRGSDVEQRVAFAMVARSPIERLMAFKKERGWRNLKLYSDTSGDYTRDYVSADDADFPAFNVFTRRDGTIRHFWSGEMGFETADPGQDPRGAPDLMPLWTILDATPEGRGRDWYPKLAY